MRAASWHRLLLDVPTEDSGRGPRVGPCSAPASPAAGEGGRSPRGCGSQERVRFLGAGAAQ